MKTMQRQRGELVPIGEVVSGLDDVLVTAIRDDSPQARRGFTRFDQVNQLVSASEADPAQVPQRVRNPAGQHIAVERRVSGRLVRFCTLSGAFPTSVEVPASVSDGS